MLDEGSMEFLEVQDKVREKIKAFLDGYVNRKIEKIDDFMEDMFSKEEACFVLGIGDEELCLGIKETREMVEVDWQSWGKLGLDIESLGITTDGTSAYFTLDGTSTYCFQDSEERYERYINSIASYFGENSVYRNLTYRARLAQINWQLSTLLSTRQEGVREYLWPLKLSGFMCKEGDNWRFKSMQFAFKRASRHPDVRFDTALSLDNVHAESRERVHIFMLSNKEFYNSEVIKFAQKLQSHYLQSNNIDGLIDDGIFDNNIIISSTYGNTYRGFEDVKAFIELYKKFWDGITVDYRRLLSLHFNEGTYFIATGYLSRHVTQNQAIIEEVANLKKTIKQDMPPKDKLFKIRKDISRTIMETFKGEDYICPVRIEGLAEKREDEYSIVRLNFTLPSYWIMEGMYD